MVTTPRVEIDAVQYAERRFRRRRLCCDNRPISCASAAPRESEMTIAILPASATTDRDPWTRARKAMVRRAQFAWIAVVGTLASAPALADVKVAFIDPFSGGAASTGIWPKTHQFTSTRSTRPINGEDPAPRQQGQPQNR
jgi:hypothetical protein